MHTPSAHIVIVQPGYTAAFGFNKNRVDILEATERLHFSLPDGNVRWDWESAGICDGRGDDPELVARIHAVLERITPPMEMTCPVCGYGALISDTPELTHDRHVSIVRHCTSCDTVFRDDHDLSSPTRQLLRRGAEV